MPYLFTPESVSEGHPVKVADQISDELINNLLAFDKESKVACETLFTTGQVVLAGEVKSNRNFVIGGPHSYTGLIGRKIIVDSYGGKGAHGGVTKPTSININAF